MAKKRKSVKGSKKTKGRAIKNTVPVTAVISSGLDKKLKAHVKSKQSSVSAVVRELLEKFLSKK